MTWFIWRWWQEVLYPIFWNVLALWYVKERQHNWFEGINFSSMSTDPHPCRTLCWSWIHLWIPFSSRSALGLGGNVFINVTIQQNRKVGGLPRAQKAGPQLSLKCQMLHGRNSTWADDKLTRLEGPWKQKPYSPAHCT